MQYDPIKVSSVLGDPTRLAIYQFVLKTEDPVSAQDVAQHFDLHPNVARMHLSKLADLGLLSAQAERGGRGRPGMLYASSGQSVGFSFPNRDFQLLSELLSETISALGDSAKPVLQKVGRDFGRRLGRRSLEDSEVSGKQPSTEELLAISAKALQPHGIDLAMPEGSAGTVQLTLHGCSFKEVATTHPDLVCALCSNIVQGVLETQTEVDTLKTTGTVPTGNKCCTFEATVELHDQLPMIGDDGLLQTSK